jgi:two-component system nitrate/nitrite response regulator NarL
LVEALSASADLEVVGEADNDQAAIEHIRLSEPEVALLELQSPRFDGIRLIEAVVQNGLTTRAILMFHAPPGGSIVHKALRAGARGVVSAQIDAAAMLEAVAAVTNGQLALSAHEQTELGHEIHKRNREDPLRLSERELEVLKLAAEGFTAEYIANSLVLSPATVKTYLSRIYRKLGVSNKAAAVAIAIRNGWLQLAIGVLLWEPPEL